MANFVFNAAKGKIAGYTDRVKQNDPANSALLIVPLSASGTEAQGQDHLTLSALLGAGIFVELTGSGWLRKTITDAEITTAPTVDATLDEMQSFFDNVTWTGVTALTSTGVLVCYDPDTTSGTDTSVVPLSHHDFIATGNGGNIGLTIPANGYARSQ